MRLYIAVLDEVPDFIVPTLVAHTMLAAHLKFEKNENYQKWLQNSFKKVTVSVNRKEFDKISNIENVYLGHENKTLNAIKSCAITIPCENEFLPNVLKFAKLWKPKVAN
jgi:hypothetical protein